MDALTMDAVRYRLDSITWKLRRKVGGNLPQSPTIALRELHELVDEDS